VAREQPKAVRSNATTPSSPKASPKAEVGDAAKDEEEDQEEGGRSYWLMKAEPESRIEKGVDVKFSIDDLREAAEPEPWDGKSCYLSSWQGYGLLIYPVLGVRNPAGMIILLFENYRGWLTC
jgi:hypothetical protein